MDDVIAFSPNPKKITEFVTSMQKEEPQSYVLEDLGDVTSYLGIQVHKSKAGMINLTQPHLISKILASAGFEQREINPALMPAAEVLKKYPDSKSVPTSEFHYQSVIRQLNYLANTMCPDIAIAVHQWACFSYNPKEPHAKAVKHIVWYLAGTHTKRLIL